MIEFLQKYSDPLTIPVLCFCLPGTLFILSGIRTMRNKKRLSVGIDSHFRWKPPVVLKGQVAVKEGKWDIAFGIFLCSIGLAAVIGTLL